VIRDGVILGAELMTVAASLRDLKGNKVGTIADNASERNRGRCQDKQGDMFMLRGSLIDMSFDHATKVQTFDK